MSYTITGFKALTICALSCVLFPLFSFGQNDQLSPDSLIARGNALLEKGVALTETNLDSSLYYKKAALPYFEKAVHWENYVSCLNSIAFIYYYKGNYEQSNAQAELAYQKAKLHLKEESTVYSDALNNLSIFLKQKGDYEKAIELYEQSIAIQKRVSFDKAAIAASYHNLGHVLKRKGDLEESINYYTKALELRLDTFGLNHIEVARNFLVLGNSHRDKGATKTALDFYQKCLQITRGPNIAQGKRRDQVLINSYQNIATIQSEQLRLDSTIHYINLALDLQPEDHSFRKSRSYEVLGKIYSKKGKYVQAIDYFKKAKTFSAIEYQAYKKHVVFTKLSYQTGLTYAKQQKTDLALTHFQTALQEVSFDFKESDFVQNPELNNLFSKFDALDILIAKANTLQQKHLQTKAVKYLQAAYKTYQLAAEVIQFLREYNTTTKSKYRLAEKALPVYENAIQTAIELHEKTGEEKYVSEAFTFAESNKAVLLLAELRDNMAKGFGEIPDTLLAQEKDLKLKLSFYEEKISLAKRRTKIKDQEKLKNWEDLRFNLREQYKQLVKSFEDNYPKYYQLKYDNALVQTTELQAMLPPQSMAIEYFVGLEKIYIFGIHPSEIQVKTIDNSKQLLTTVEQLRSYVSNPPQSEGAKEKLDVFAEQAYELYQQLVAPILSNTDASIAQLLIIPDDFLSYIPYDLLLTESPEGMIKSLSLEDAYLLQKYAISYHYSASLWLNKRSIPIVGERAIYAGFAPSFEQKNEDQKRFCAESQLYSLSCNDSEVDGIQQMLKGKAFARKKASKATFEEIASNYQIIHLATHACVDDDDPMLSKIYFTDDHLSNYELYNLNLKADLAVLSACNTGSGKLVKGEGVMSLARGFIHAGCPSVLMSLWSVDDCTTSDLMQGFYAEIMEGKSKDEALRQAKRDYLSSVDRMYLHPYYWSAFVQFGDFTPMHFDYNWGGKWPLIGGAAVLLLMLGWWRFGD